MLETTGLKEADSSVEIYVNTILTDEATHTHEHMQINKQDR